MSKSLVLKALSLLQEENKDKLQKDDSKSLTRKHKRKKTAKALYGTPATPYAPVDKTAKNLEVLKRLKELRPKSSVAQKVIQFYTKQNKPEDDATEGKPQRSILFDDDVDDEEILKRKKTRRKQEEEDDI